MEARYTDAVLPCQRPLGQLTPPRQWLLSKSWKLQFTSSVLCFPELAASGCPVQRLSVHPRCASSHCTSAGLDVVSLLQDPASQGQSVMLEPMRNKALRSVSPV